METRSFSRQLAVAVWWLIYLNNFVHILAIGTSSRTAYLFRVRRTENIANGTNHLNPGLGFDELLADIRYLLDC
jgi:hypothetical protein